jgi:hypothetical protein
MVKDKYVQGITELSVFQLQKRVSIFLSAHDITHNIILSKEDTQKLVETLQFYLQNIEEGNDYHLRILNELDDEL